MDLMRPQTRLSGLLEAVGKQIKDFITTEDYEIINAVLMHNVSTCRQRVSWQRN